MAATMDHATGGRFVLGLGAGGQRNEHVAYGMALRSISRRLDAFEEACAVIRSLLTQPRTTFDGAFYQLAEAPCEPKPVQTPLPLLIGGGGERRTLRIAAQFADEWHVWGTPAEFRHKSEILDRHCEDIGRDRSTIRRATGALVLRSGGRGAGDRDDLGSPASILDLLGAYRAAGADEFIARDHREAPLAESRDSLSLCAEAIATLR
jgi:alkanesulfonate monooxygenase SsuD/methylene tetrahydromethanopterin reductase-like flavin-dependent oxidoreductase (luciferase family)